MIRLRNTGLALALLLGLLSLGASARAATIEIRYELVSASMTWCHACVSGPVAGATVRVRMTPGTFASTVTSTDVLFEIYKFRVIGTAGERLSLPSPVAKTTDLHSISYGGSASGWFSSGFNFRFRVPQFDSVFQKTGFIGRTASLNFWFLGDELWLRFDALTEETVNETRTHRETVRGFLTFREVYRSVVPEPRVLPLGAGVIAALPAALGLWRLRRAR